MATDNDIQRVRELIMAIHDAEKEGSVTNVMVADVLNELADFLSGKRELLQQVIDDPDFAASSQAVKKFVEEKLKDFKGGPEVEQKLSESPDKVPSSKAVLDGIKGTINSTVQYGNENVPSGKAVTDFMATNLGVLVFNGTIDRIIASFDDGPIVSYDCIMWYPTGKAFVARIGNKYYKTWPGCQLWGKEDSNGVVPVDGKVYLDLHSSTFLTLKDGQLEEVLKVATSENDGLMSKAMAAVVTKLSELNADEFLTALQGDGLLQIGHTIEQSSEGLSQKATFLQKIQGKWVKRDGNPVPLQEATRNQPGLMGKEQANTLEKIGTSYENANKRQGLVMLDGDGVLPEGVMNPKDVAKIKEGAEEVFAKKDGAYEGMLVGSALNLQGDSETADSSMYRTAGGTADIASGLAELMSIRGNAVAWNQLQNIIINEPNKVLNYDNTEGEEISYYSFGAYGKGVPPNHVMYENIIFSKCVCNGRVRLYQNVRGLGMGGAGNSSNIYLKNGILRYSAIGVSNGETNNYANTILSLDSGANIDAIVKSMVLIDLTLIYGAGNEPSTPEEFEADYQRWFGKPLTYEEYDEGSLRNVKANGLKTVGFNLSPISEFEGTAGEWQNNGALFTNDCNYEGQICIQATVNGSFQQFKTYANRKVESIHAGYGNNALMFTVRYSDNGLQYCAFESAFSSASPTAKVENICINFSWSGKRDGDFEEHWEEEKPLPLTTLKGKLNGEGESVAVFPDGMKRAGDVYDEIRIENGVVKAIKRVGSVDLGTLGWEYVSSYINPFFRASISNMRQSLPSSESLGNIISERYTNVPIGILLGVEQNKIISEHSTTEKIYIVDKEYSTTAEFKAAMAGVILYYELAEPEEYILEDFTLPLLYKVDDFGTEQILSPEGTVAPTLMIKYGVNAVDTLRRLPSNYISVESMDALLSKLSAATGGTWSRVWNESTHSYDFNFIQKTSTIQE